MNKLQMSPPPFMQVEHASLPYSHAVALLSNSFCAPLNRRNIEDRPKRETYTMEWFLITHFTIQEAIRRHLFLTIAILTLLVLVLFGLLIHATVNQIQEN